MNETGQQAFCFVLREIIYRDVVVRAKSREEAQAKAKVHYVKALWFGGPRRGIAHILDDHGNKLDEMRLV